MAKIRLLIDTDIFIDFFNRGDLADLFQGRDFEICYSIVTRKELLSKRGIKKSERQTIRSFLSRFRLIRLTSAITDAYSRLRARYPRIEKEDALIAATAMTLDCHLVSRNRRHFRSIRGLSLFVPPAHPPRQP